MDAQAVALLSTLKRPAASSETKLAALNSLKSDIKHYRVPESALATIVECLKLAITQQASSTLASSAFSALGHLIKRIKIQDESGHAIAQLGPRLFPALEDRLGDSKEPIRAAAGQALSEIYPFCPGDVETIIRDNAIGGSNPRSKQSGIQWVLQMHEAEGMPFKSYVQPIVARLEDADGTVRDTARVTLVELFKNAPERAKTDLKRQLKAFSVRHSIESQILSQIGAAAAPGSRNPASGQTDLEPDMMASTRSLPSADHAARLAESINSEAARPPPAETIQMDPLFVQSRAELDDIFRNMLPFFEGRETEQNWTPRDRSIVKLRQLTRGNAPSEFHSAFMAGIKSMVECILKVANSLRTTMSTNGCLVVQELAQTLGPALDPHVEMFLQSFMKMSAATKHIASENGKVTAEALFQHCSYNSRTMQHIWAAAQDKNAQVRQCIPDWLRTVLGRQANYKTHFETTGGLELADKCISKGLDDANPKVKEGMRATYWLFAKNWPDRAQVIMSKLDPKTKSALERDPSNPNASLMGGRASTTAVPARATGAASRNALREMLAEQRKAKAARGLPERPNSAMAQLSPAKPRSATAASARGPSNLSHETGGEHRAASVATTASDISASAKKGSSLMSAPVRRPRRPEVPRPQTADPYAARRLLRPETPAHATPSNSPPKTGASKASYSSSTAAARNRARVAGDENGSPAGSPARNSPRIGHAHPVRLYGQDSRPTSKGNDVDLSNAREDDLTMVLPGNRASAAERRPPFAPGHKRTTLGHSASMDSGIPSVTETDDEGFTMVLPNLPATQQRGRSPLSYRSPLKAMFDEARERMEALSPRLHGVMEDARSEEVATPLRSVSPIKASAVAEDVQVYEDPYTSNGAGAPAGHERKVLAELPVNENVPAQSPAPMARSPLGSPQRGIDPAALSPHDRADGSNCRRLLNSGLERIRSRTLDVHGFRRMQELVKHPLETWDGGQLYDELMAALLWYLQNPEAPPRPATAALQTQALALTRALMAQHRKPAAAWHAKALLTVLGCQRGADAAGPAAAELERAADEVARATPAPDACADAVVTALPTLPSPRCAAAALATLRRLLASAAARRVELGAARQVRLVRVCAAYLDHADAEVRRADVELASELFELFGSSKAEFWAEFRGTDEGRLGLLTYYIARRGRLAAGGIAAA